jgi:hypothetical protein
MGRYIQPTDIQTRLLGKVKFTNDPNEANLFQLTLLSELIDQAEGQVELDLSPRYSGPFTTYTGQPFDSLKTLVINGNKGAGLAAWSMIRALCQYQSVIRVIEYDFGRSTAISGEKYLEKIEARYKSFVEKKLLAKKKLGDMESQQWQFPPLPLTLNYMNSAADDGYMGQILNTTQTVPQFPQFQINDPSESFWTGIFDDPNVSPTGNLAGYRWPGGSDRG